MLVVSGMRLRIFDMVDGMNLDGRCLPSCKNSPGNRKAKKATPTSITSSPSS